jgi:hypothetical protein
VGHASEKIRESLADGKLLNIELIDYIEVNMGFDETKYLKTARRDLNISISKSLPQGEALTVIEKVKLWANHNNYKEMRIRWRDPNSQATQSAKIDTIRKDAGEALFIKSSDVHLEAAIPDISEEMSNELIIKMAKLVE